MAGEIRIRSFLENLPLFSELDAQYLERIAAAAHLVHAARGTMLFNKGDACEGFHSVVYGQVKLAFTAPSGTEKVVELIGAGQSFGEAVMFMERSYPVYAQTLADSLLVHVTKQAVFEEIERDPRFARRMIGGLSRRLHGIILDIEAYTLQSGMQRVLGYLLRGAPEGEPHAAVDVALSANKNVLASRLNLTPEHFSRILHDLAEEGLIRVERRSIRILDLDALRRYES